MFIQIKSTLLTVTALAVLAIPTPSSAQVPSPRLKPQAAQTTAYPRMRSYSVVRSDSKYLSKSDFKNLKAGLSAARKRQWSRVDRARAAISDPIAQDLLMWARVERDSKAPFASKTYVAQQLPDWPARTKIMARAESDLFDNPLSAQRTIGWFMGKDPVSGEGRAALARAYYANGDNASGDKWLKLAWRESRLTRARQQELFGQYKTKLTPADHYARADHLIWQGRSHHASALALTPYMGRDHRALINARIKLAGNRSGVDAAVKAVSKNMQDDPGLMYERANWRKKRQSKANGLALYAQMTAAPESKAGQRTVWRAKRNLIYWALKERRYNEAYKLCLNHGMDSGSGFAEAEFLGGWIALTKLGQAQKAAQHFETLSQGVSYPVSLSRAYYWQGRAAERLGNGNDRAYYSQAAQYPNTYYGQLANERMDGSAAKITLPPQADTKSLRAEFESRSIVRAMHMLGEVGEESWFNDFAFHLDDEVEDIRELALVSQIAAEYGYMKPSIRAAKQSARFQTMLTESGYPKIAAIDTLPSKFDKPLVFAIARQESEFNYKAVSSAKAYGLMQMINGTARLTANKHRVPYSKSRLTQDIDYNANLGALHLNDLLKQFDGSYIMTAAAYNAGAGRVRTWNKQFGDPRKGEIDPIDWIESIPFSETRNYVQRVMENVQVYRARLSNDQAQSRITQDITHGKL